MTTPNPEIIRLRLDTAISASGRSVAEIEQGAGLNRDRLRDFLNGRKQTLTLADAASAAGELGISLTWLAGTDAAPVPAGEDAAP